MDFVYKTDFVGGAAAGKKNVYLCFDGLDTVCTIWLNGERLGDAEDCHLAYEFNVSGKLRAGKNALLVVFRSPWVEGEKRRDAAGLAFPRPHLGIPFAFIRKPAYSFFWDWGPQIPVSGIFRPVYIKAFDRAEISDVHIRYTIQGNDVSGRVEVSSRGDAGSAVTLRIGGAEFSAPLTGKKTVVPFALSNVNLWYPNGEGEPFLYDVETSLLDGATVLDVRKQRVGFRTIVWLRDDRPDGRGKRFVVTVNGKEIFCRGYNWIPVDNAIPRGYYGLYKGNLDLAKAGNANMLRIWGGGYYEDDEFYRLCDERGIMVWQDGAFACSLYPDTDPAFMALVKRELTYNIKRLRNCTSLVLWCGENENHWGYDDWWKNENHFNHFYGSNIYDKLFPDLVKELDPDRFYWNGSPFTEEPGIRANDELRGDTHYWDLHSNCGDLSGYLSSAPSFVSETGIQSLPDLRTALTIGGPEDRNIQSFVFDTRNQFENPAKNDRLLKFSGALFRVSDDFNQAVLLSNLGHAEYLKYAVEHWRSQANQCAGVLIWQLNDCWPAISWAVVDYNLIPKACFYYLQRAYAPTIVGFKQHYSIDYGPDANSRGELFVSSERDGVRSGEVELTVMRVDGEIMQTHRFPVTLTGRGAASLGEIQLAEYAARRFDCLASFRLRLSDGTVARNVYTFSRPKHMRLPAPHIEVRQSAADSVTVRSDVFVKGVYLFHADKSAIFADNYFDLLPGEEKIVGVSQPVAAADVQAMYYGGK
jgi:beta-mannosidase